MTLSVFLFSTCWQEIRYIGSIASLKNCHQVKLLCALSSGWKFTHAFKEEVKDEFSPMIYTVKVSLWKSPGWIFTHCVHGVSGPLWKYDEFSPMLSGKKILEWRTAKVKTFFLYIILNLSDPLILPCKWAPRQRSPLFQDHFCLVFRIVFKEGFHCNGKLW